MNIKDIRNLADGTQLIASYKVVFTKTADGLYCSDNKHLYTWWNVEYTKMADRLNVVGAKQVIYRDTDGIIKKGSIEQARNKLIIRADGN